MAFILSSPVYAQTEYLKDRRYRQAVRLYEKGAYSAAKSGFDILLSEDPSNETVAAYSVLSSLRAGNSSAAAEADEFRMRFPYSKSVRMMDYYLASNRFDEHRYAECMELLESVPPSCLSKEDRPVRDFMLAYSYFMEGYDTEAGSLLEEMHASYGKKGLKGLYAPAEYLSGYLFYKNADFRQAASHFENSVADHRFSVLSRFYLIECHYLMKDYRYVTEIGREGLEDFRGEYRKNAARMLSESYMALGMDKEAGAYYEKYFESEGDFGRTDYYFAGMMAYGLGKYADAVGDFSRVTGTRDSIAQSAYYYQGDSYIKSGNKIAAIDAFREAAAMDFDKELKEDAMFNLAKLRFDVNEDISGFEAYMEEYPSSRRSDEIYAYMASAYMFDRDYSSAIDAYMKIGSLTSSVRESFRKALFLRSMQLISAGSYSRTIPLLKQVVSLKDGDGLAFMAEYWLAEAYYRNDNFWKAIEINVSLSGKREFSRLPEYSMLDYNLGYDYFKLEDYASAEKYFRNFLSSSPSTHRREARLRLADCLFMQREYEQAAAMYESCVTDFYDKSDIYPVYQAAIAYGLVPMEAKKISVLERLSEYNPGVKYYDYALFELGRSYIKIDDDVKAEEIFSRLKSMSGDTTVIAASNIELGSLYRNRLEYGKALEYYKEVAEKMPLSVYSQDALAAIESIYTLENDPQGYLAYIDSIGKSFIKTPDEKENMIFSAAEQIFLKGDYAAALASLESFLKEYPSSSKRSQAYFYMAESEKALGRYEKAVDAYYQVMRIGEGAYAESATLNYAELSYALERYAQAYEGYSTLAEIAALDNNRYTALTGVMRSRFRMKDYAGAITAADKLQESPYCDERAVRELCYVKAKSYIALSDRESAAPLLEKLAADPQTDEGAEATYILIQEVYDSGRFEDVENMVYAFSDAAPSQQYFLARSFIVLGDSFAERDEWEQAKATFESIRDNYRASGEGDDISAQVQMRLDRIAEMGL